MSSSALRRSLLRRGSLRRLLPSDPPSSAPAAAASFQRSFQSGEGEGESVDDFEERLFGSKGSDDIPIFRKLDGIRNPRGRYDMGSGMGVFGRYSDRSNSGYSDRSNYGILEGFDFLNDGMGEELDNAAHTFHVTEDVDDDDYNFRPDVTYRRGSTYNVRDLDLTRPAAPKNPPRPQFETTTAEVLRKADFRNVRFLSNFLTEAGIIIKRSQTRISAKAQRLSQRWVKDYSSSAEAWRRMLRKRNMNTIL